MPFSKIFSLLRTSLSLLFLATVLPCSAGSLQANEFSNHTLQSPATTDQTYYHDAHPYLEEPLEQLIKRVPELKTIQPAQDQQPLSTILENAAKKVDQFFSNIVDLTAHEQITEERQDSRRNVRNRLQAEDSYLILRRGNDIWRHVTEYRVDSQGNLVEEVGLSKGYFDTSHFALNHIYFAATHQPESTFFYLGEQNINSHDTYVVAFAQKPGEASITVAMEGREAADARYVAHMLVQGIAWIDKHTFQILRLRTDLLAPRPEIHLARLTTTVTFGQMQLPDIATPLWLPSIMQVFAEFTELDTFSGLPYTVVFHNEHQYSNYQGYRVSAKMITDSPMPANQPGYSIPTEESDQSYYANAHPYLDEPLNELTKRIPELKKLRPADSQGALPEILKKSATNVDSFFHSIVDLIAREEIVQQRMNYLGIVTSAEQVRDNYLILRHSNGPHTDIDEYRMNAKGNRMDHIGLERGYVVTFGFALNSNYFSTALQPESKFRYLGDQKIGARDTYVVAFAQQPGLADLFVTMIGTRGTKIHMLTQGIAWLDKSNFQIIRMRTDLLAPRPEIGLDRQTTEVAFNQVQLPDVATPLWLPSEVKVYVKFKSVDPERQLTYEQSYQNEHHYSDYRRYRVSVKMLTPP